MHYFLWFLFWTASLFAVPKSCLYEGVYELSAQGVDTENLRLIFFRNTPIGGDRVYLVDPYTPEVLASFIVQANNPNGNSFVGKSLTPDPQSIEFEIDAHAYVKGIIEIEGKYAGFYGVQIQTTTTLFHEGDSLQESALLGKYEGHIGSYRGQLEISKKNQITGPLIAVFRRENNFDEIRFPYSFLYAMERVITFSAMVGTYGLTKWLLTPCTSCGMKLLKGIGMESETGRFFDLDFKKIPS